MFSPLFLLAPIGEVEAELAVTRRLAVALLAGAGRIAARSPSLTTHVTIYDVGAQLQYYLLGDFRHGMQIGAQILYERYDSPFTHQDPFFGNALQVGPFAGYKRTLRRGFTLEAQLGYQRTWIWQHTAGDPASAAVRVTDSGLLLNLNVGWSF